MASIPLNSTPFTGTSRSVTYLRTAKPPGAECLSCGSSLHGRAIGERKWGGQVVRVYACECGTTRRLPVRGKREVAAAA